MKKHIFAILLIITGFTILAYIYSQNSKTEYSETLFSSESQEFNLAFTSFLNGVEQNINAIQTNFIDNSKIKDSSYTQNFFKNLIKDNPYIMSVAYRQNNYKFAIHKEDNSFVYGIDSTQNIDIITWKRIEGGKIISSWQESFEEPINSTSWYNQLNKNQDQLQWLLNIEDEENKDELFYCGYSYQTENIKNTILFRFSRKSLFKYFDINSSFNHLNLMIKTPKGNEIDLGYGITNNFDLKNKDRIKDQNLYESIKNHYKKFNQSESGIFNFKLKEEVYWNSYKKFDAKTGILYYLLTIPNKDLQKVEADRFKDYIFWGALLLIMIGLLLFLKKSKLFYRSNKINMPPVKELLSGEENRYLEFKSSSRWDYRQEKTNPKLEDVIIKTIAAFGNTDGGILLIGVDDDKKILGLEKDFSTLKKPNADYYEVHLRNILHKLMGVKNVSENIRIQFEKLDKQKIVCKIKVFAANEPIFFKFKNNNGQIEEKFFVRSGNSSQEIKSLADINDYINTRFK